jgi:Fe2+ or Zn2+ uptake regulation protein
MLNSHESKTLLREVGLYCTAARVAIVEVLRQTEHPLSQEQIGQALDMHADKVTIYRTLTSLIEANLLHRVYVDQHKAYYGLAYHSSEQQCHPHLKCTSCGKIYCLPDLEIRCAKSPHNGFIIKHQQVLLEGLCPACA